MNQHPIMRGNSRKYRIKSRYGNIIGNRAFKTARNKSFNCQPSGICVVARYYDSLQFHDTGAENNAAL
nr:MAG TPA: hypothetical protein [Caudoviricetes sp.]